MDNLDNFAFRMYVMDRFIKNKQDTPNIYKRIAYQNAMNSISNNSFISSLTSGMKGKIETYYGEFKNIHVVDKFDVGIVVKIKNVTRSDARNVIRSIRKLINVDKFTVCGSYSRGEKYLHDVDIVIMVGDMKRDVIDKLNKFITILRKGKNMISFIYNGIQVDITRVENVKEYIFMIMHCTGPKELNIRMRKHAKKMGYKLNQYGLYKNGERIKQNFKTVTQIKKFLSFSKKF